MNGRIVQQEYLPINCLSIKLSKLPPLPGIKPILRAVAVGCATGKRARERHVGEIQGRASRDPSQQMIHWSNLREGRASSWAVTDRERYYAVRWCKRQPLLRISPSKCHSSSAPGGGRIGVDFPICVAVVPNTANIQPGLRQVI